MLIGIALGLGASACWAMANVAIQRTGRSLGSVRALLWAQLVGLAGVALLAPWVDAPTAGFDARMLAWCAVAGVSALVAYVALFIAFEGADLSVCVPIMSSWSALSAILSVVVLGERLRTSTAAGAAVVIAGALIVAITEGRASMKAARADAAAPPPEPPVDDQAPGTGTAVARRDPRLARRALVASIAAAVGFGVLVPAVGQIAPATGRVGAIGVVFALDLLLGLPLALLWRQPLGLPTRAAWPLVVVAGLAETVGFVLVSWAGLFAPMAVVSPLASLAATLTVGFAWLVLRERPPRLAAVGAALACLGVILLAL